MMKEPLEVKTIKVTIIGDSPLVMTGWNVERKDDWRAKRWYTKSVITGERNTTV